MIVNNDYLKEFLTDRIASKAIEATHKKQVSKITANKMRSRAFKFRSGSVMNPRVNRVPTSVKEAE